MTDPNATAIASALLQSPTILAVLVGVGLVVICKGVNEVQSLIDRNRQKPAPREVQDEARAGAAGLGNRVTELKGRIDLAEAADRQHDKRLDDHDEELAQQRERESLCAGKLHKRMDELASIVSHNGGVLSEGLANIKASQAELRSLILSGRKHA